MTVVTGFRFEMMFLYRIIVGNPMKSKIIKLVLVCTICIGLIAGIIMIYQYFKK